MKFEILYTTKSNPLRRKPAKRFWISKSKESMIQYFENHAELILVEVLRRVN